MGLSFSTQGSTNEPTGFRAALSPSKWLASLTLGLILTLAAAAQPLGKALDDFTLQTLDGKKTSLSALRQDSKALLVMFWCTTCPSCRSVELDFDRLAARLEGKVRLLAISSSKQDNADKIRAFQKARKVSFPVLLDPGSQMAHQLGVEWTTTSILLDSQGRVRYWGAYASGSDRHAQAAIEALLSGRRILRPTTPAEG